MRVLVTDVDGVLLDIYGAVESAVRERYNSDEVYHNFDVNSITDWNMSGIRDDVRNFILGCFGSREFIDGLPLYDKALDGLHKLYGLAERLDGKVQVNTGSTSADAYEARKQWLHRLKKNTGLNFEIVVAGAGEKKRFPKTAYALFEDNLDNIRGCISEYCYIIDQCHNREAYNRSYVDVFFKAVRNNSFYEAVCDFEHRISIQLEYCDKVRSKRNRFVAVPT